MLCDLGGKISFIGSSRCAVGLYFRVTVYNAHTDRYAEFTYRRSFVAEKALFKPYLCLGTQVVMKTCQHDDDFVTRIGSLTYKPRIVASLARLYVTYN